MASDKAQDVTQEDAVHGSAEAPTCRRPCRSGKFWGRNYGVGVKLPQAPSA